MARGPSTKQASGGCLALGRTEPHEEEEWCLQSMPSSLTLAQVVTPFLGQGGLLRGEAGARSRLSMGGEESELEVRGGGVSGRVKEETAENIFPGDEQGCDELLGTVGLLGSK